MPIFLYQCSACNARTEEFQKIGDPPPEKCGVCGKDQTMVKKMGVTNFELKGAGWAKDGYS